VKVECGGKEASANMARLAPVGAKATLTADPTQDKVDRYGRMLAYVTVNHRILQREQVYDGWAEVYVYGGHAVPAGRQPSARAEGVAKRAHRGVWGSLLGRLP
jgi:micrococcal nuclease